MSNYDLIEGSFKNFNYRRIVPKDYDGVCKHIRDHFIHMELTSKTLGVTEDYADEFEELVKVVLKENASFLAEQKDSKEIACLRLNFIDKKDENIFKHLKIQSRQLKVILQLFAELDEIAKVYETYGVDEYVMFFAASTDPKFQNQGLTREMYARSLRFLKAEGHKLCKVFTSSPYSGAATKTVGFQEVGRVDYENMKDAYGNPIFDPKVLTPGHFALVKVFEL